MKKQIEFIKNNEVVGKSYYDLLSEKDKKLMHEEGRKLGAKFIRIERNFIIGVKYDDKMPQIFKKKSED